MYVSIGGKDQVGVECNESMFVSIGIAYNDHDIDGKNQIYIQYVHLDFNAHVIAGGKDKVGVEYSEQKSKSPRHRR